MSTNRRDLKMYERIDGSGRAVPGSAVLRKKKPSGRFVEVTSYNCCVPTTTTTTTASPTTTTTTTL